VTTGVSRLNRVDRLTSAEFATDLKDVYPNKEVTLLHSRMRFMPHYPVAMHTASEPPRRCTRVAVIAC
jgi:hypothetical protein